MGGSTTAAGPEPGWALIESGTPYHLLARNSAYRWWRPLATLLVAAVLCLGGAVAASAVLTVMLAFPNGHVAPWLVLAPRPTAALEAALDDPMWTLVGSFAVIPVLLLAVFVTVRWTQRRPFSSVGSVVGRLRWRWLAESLGLAVLLLTIAFAVSAAFGSAGQTGPGFPGWGRYLSILAIAVLLVPVQSAAEEFVFRGLLLQTFSAWFRFPWPGIVLSSLLFVGGHEYRDPLVMADLLVMAVAMCWLTIRTGGLEAAIGWHAANNALSLIVGGLSGVPDLAHPGGFAPMDVLPMTVAVLLYAWLADRRAARRELSTVTGGRVRITPLALRPAMGVAMAGPTVLR